MAARSRILRTLAYSSASSLQPISSRQITYRSFSWAYSRSAVQRAHVNHIQKRWDSSAQTKKDWKRCNFIQVLEYTKTPKEKPLIIDVREPHEYVAGHIPGAVNMPVNSVPDGIFLDPDAFEDKFGFSKPDTDAHVLFYCKAGVRSQTSATFAKQAGYGKISEYSGSFDDWLKNKGPSKPGKSP